MNDNEFLPLLVPFVASTLALALTQNGWLTMVLFLFTGSVASVMYAKNS